MEDTNINPTHQFYISKIFRRIHELDERIYELEKLLDKPYVRYKGDKIE